MLSRYADMHLLYGERLGNISAAVVFIALGFLTEECPVDKLLWKLPKGCEKPSYFSLQCVDDAHNDQNTC
jgi:hypothetical protein